MDGPASDRGYVFAATGAKYVDLARRTARNLAAVSPGIPIDLFTDRDVDDAIFARVHRLEGVDNVRPKMEALGRSRFGRTLYLDADVVAIADPSDLFELLTAADIVGAHEQYGNYDVRKNAGRPDIPPTFREINSGVLGIRKCDETDRLLRDWHMDYTYREETLDQPVLRELLWDRREVRLVVLPMEYNLMHTRLVQSFGKRMCAPRLLHITGLHTRMSDDAAPTTPVDLNEVLARPTVEAIASLLAGDASLGGTPPLADRIAAHLRRFPAAHKAAKGLWQRLR